MSAKVKEIITKKLVAAIEKGGLNFTMPFSQNGFYNITSLKPYRGVNKLTCGIMGNGDSYFATYGQWQELCFGTKGRETPSPLKEDAKGAGVPIIFYKMLENKDKTTGKESTFPLMRYSTAFGISHIEEELIPAKVLDKIDKLEGVSQKNKEFRRSHIDNYICNTEAIIDYNGTRACYMPSKDTIEMPKVSLWNDIGQYYPVLFHELTHWTKAKTRCDRPSAKAWGDREYAFEELIAELGAAFLSEMTGISAEPRDDHAAYLNSWLKSMGEDTDYIFKAAKFAQEAVDYIESLQSDIYKV